MPIRSLTGITAALLLTATAAHADEGSKAYTQCMDNASSTSLMSTCIQTETQLQDQRLNRAYKQIMGKLDAQKQKSLREVQRNWISYRDSNCKFWSGLSGGTISQVDGAMCVKDMTRDRAAELERMFDPTR